MPPAPLVLPPAPTGVAPPPAATGASMPRTAYAITPASNPEQPAKSSEAPHCDPHDNHHRTARAPRLRPCPWPLPLRVPPRRESFRPLSPYQPPPPITGASPRPGPSGAGCRRHPACGRLQREGVVRATHLFTFHLEQGRGLLPRIVCRPATSRRILATTQLSMHQNLRRIHRREMWRCM